MKRIVVATDLSRASLPALQQAAELGRALKAELIVLFVAELFDGSADFLDPGALNSALEAQEKTARRHLHRWILRMKKRGIRARSLVVTGSAASVIVATARKLRADLIVLGTHGRAGLSHLLIGSVAERVVRTAACPVLTVRSRRRRQAVSPPAATRPPSPGRSGGRRRISTVTLI